MLRCTSTIIQYTTREYTTVVYEISQYNGSYALKCYICYNLHGTISENTGLLYCEDYDYEEVPDDNLETPLSNPFSTKRTKKLNFSDGFMLYGKLGVDFFCPIPN